ncbi:Tn3 family transposase [Hymenobacter sediminis]|uniref:Tn3 family transposase n=1 Tax=Hymenobacter sediminis TaxID=2218621 RepID=UPI000DA650EF|nr:Tn3 family transposase [Hymenobacter sediminis]RPD44082.1 Tn3 family transposase [Hymenobacter sediminis]
MATHLRIHLGKERELYEQPPLVPATEQARVFAVPAWADGHLARMLVPANRVGFLLQLGYFQISQRFYVATRYHAADVAYVAQQLGLEPDDFDPLRYADARYYAHQQLLCEQLGIARFDAAATERLYQEAVRLSSQHLKPSTVFDYLVLFLHEHRLELPTYNTLADLITRALLAFEKRLLHRLQQHLQPGEQRLLDRLLAADDPDAREADADRRYPLTFLKRIRQGLRAGEIRERVTHFASLRQLFEQLQPLWQRLRLSDQAITYYAEYVLRAQAAQLYRRDERRYLYLLSFVVHQYYELGDALVDTLLQTMTSAANQCREQVKETLYQQRTATQQLTNQVTGRGYRHLQALTQIRALVDVPDVPAEQKLQRIDALLQRHQVTAAQLSEDHQQLEQLRQATEQQAGEALFHEALAAASLRLQTKLGTLVKALVVDEATTRADLWRAVQYYQQHDGHLGAQVPLDFLSLTQRAYVLDAQGRLRPSLYKALLFLEMATAVKSGQLNFTCCYQYRAFEHYLLPAAQWAKQREALLEQAGLSAWRDFATVQTTLQAQLQAQFAATNAHLSGADNPHAHRTPAGRYRLTTPRLPAEQPRLPAHLFPRHRVVPLREVLTSVARLTQFDTAFGSLPSKHARTPPPLSQLLAALVGLGCNLGLRRLAQVAPQVDEAALQRLASTHFSLDNLRQANELILNFTRQLRLRETFRLSPDVLHSSSDGQKYDLAVDSLGGSASFKYFGNRRGLTAYSYVDETLLVFDSTVFSAADREATHLLEGLLRHAVRPTDVHSTDTHGYTEVIFAVTRMLGIAYEPRIRQLTNQQLYSWEPVAAHRQLGQTLLPDARLDPERIARHWDEVLRLVVTLKLRHSEASRLFGRLNSYARQHPLYRALKELGRLVKTEFLLRYVDQVELRQRIQKQLNKGESAHRLAHAVWHGRNQEFHAATRSEQLVAETCKRLLMNAIICWNYLHLSQHLARLPPEQQAATLATLSPFAVLSYRHLNLHGEYDFSDHPLPAEAPFDMDLIAAWQPPSKPA